MYISLILYALAITAYDTDAMLDKRSPKVTQTEQNAILINSDYEIETTPEQPGNLVTIDPDPSVAGPARIVDRRSIEVNGEPACALTFRYANAVDQPVTWNDQSCSELTIDFLSFATLTEMGKVERLSEETIEDLKRNHIHAVLYIENDVTASIYPLNIAGRIYEVSVAD